MVRARTIEKQTQRTMLLWNPLVHDHFDENLYFYLISFRTFKIEDIELLERRIEGFGLTGFCLYTLHGQFDVLIRVWLNPMAQRRLEDSLEEMRVGSEIHQPLVFHVDRQSHWAFPGGYEAETAVRQSIDRWSSEDYVAVQAGVGTRLEGDMRKEGLLSRQQVRSENKVKFYIAVSAPGPTYAPLMEGILTEIVNTMQALTGSGVAQRRTKQVVTQSSMYQGRGFAWLIVKAVAPNIYTVSDLAIRVRAIATRFDLGTITLVLANRNPRENESINPGSLRRESQADREVYNFIPKIYAGSGSSDGDVSRDHVRSVEQFVRDNGFFRHLNPESRAWLGTLREAFSTKEKSPLSDELLASDILSSWFRAQENWFRERLEPLVVAIAKGGKKAVGAIYAETGISKGERFEVIGTMLGYFCQLCSRLSPGHLGGRADSFQYSEETRRVCNEIANLRNLVQHNDRQYLHDWQVHVASISEYLPILSQLQTLSSDAVTSWQALVREGRLA